MMLFQRWLQYMTCHFQDIHISNFKLLKIIIPATIYDYVTHIVVQWQICEKGMTVVNEVPLAMSALGQGHLICLCRAEKRGRVGMALALRRRKNQNGSNLDNIIY